MTENAERITILAHEFSAAALEYHRGRMTEKGYMMDGPIALQHFQMVGNEGKRSELFDGKPLFAVTFRKADKTDA